MKLVLVRHGQPDFNTQKWISVNNVRSSLQQYCDSHVTIRPENDPFLIDSGSAHHFMTSGLTRSQDSLMLCENVQAEVCELLNEAELPHPKKLMFPLPWPCLLGICRLGWLLGYRKNAPGLIHDLRRAKAATSLLIERAHEHTNVYIVGHGIMNRLIVRELGKRGWRVETKTGSGYWSKTVMIYPED